MQNNSEINGPFVFHRFHSIHETDVCHYNGENTDQLVFIPQKKINIRGFWVFNSTKNEKFEVAYSISVDGVNLRSGISTVSSNGEEISKIILDSDLKVESKTIVQIEVIIAKNLASKTSIITYRGVTKGPKKLKNIHEDLFTIKNQPDDTKKSSIVAPSIPAIIYCL